MGQWRVRVALLLGLVALWVPGFAGPAELWAVATAVAVGAVAWLLVGQGTGVSAPAVAVRGRVLRERAARSAFLRTRDPDADGRVRPRAPGRRVAAV